MPMPIRADENLEPIQRASLDELCSLQVDRLRRRGEVRQSVTE
jgi:hypothetical protein